MPNANQLRALGQEVRRLRNEAALTLTEVAKKIKRSQPYLSSIENAWPGTNGGDPMTPSDDVLEALAKVYDVPVSRFHGILGRTPDPDRLPEDEQIIIAGFRNAPPDDKEIMRLMAKRNLPPEEKIEPGHMQPGEMDELPDD